MPCPCSLRIIVCVFTGMLLACVWAPLAQAKPFLTPVKEGQKVSAFVPLKYEIEDRIDGDLNGDQRHDAVLVVIERGKGDVEAVRARALIVLFATESGFVLADTNDGLVSDTAWNGHLAGNGSPAISIKKGTLSVRQTSGSSGDWYEVTHRFRYDREIGRFVRIGMEESYGSESTEERTNISTNLLTAVRITSEKPARYDWQGKSLAKSRMIVTKTKLEKVPLRPLESMDGAHESSVDR